MLNDEDRLHTLIQSLQNESRDKQSLTNKDDFVAICGHFRKQFRETYFRRGQNDKVCQQVILVLSHLPAPVHHDSQLVLNSALLIYDCFSHLYANVQHQNKLIRHDLQVKYWKMIKSSFAKLLPAMHTCWPKGNESELLAVVLMLAVLCSLYRDVVDKETVEYCLEMAAEAREQGSVGLSVGDWKCSEEWINAIEQSGQRIGQIGRKSSETTRRRSERKTSEDRQLPDDFFKMGTSEVVEQRDEKTKQVKKLVEQVPEKINETVATSDSPPMSEVKIVIEDGEFEKPIVAHNETLHDESCRDLPLIDLLETTFPIVVQAELVIAVEEVNAVAVEEELQAENEVTGRVAEEMEAADVAEQVVEAVAINSTVMDVVEKVAEEEIVEEAIEEIENRQDITAPAEVQNSAKVEEEASKRDILSMPDLIDFENEQSSIVRFEKPINDEGVKLEIFSTADVMVTSGNEQLKEIEIAQSQTKIPHEEIKNELLEAESIASGHEPLTPARSNNTIIPVIVKASPVSRSFRRMPLQNFDLPRRRTLAEHKPKLRFDWRSQHLNEEDEEGADTGTGAQQAAVGVEEGAFKRAVLVHRPDDEVHI